MWPRSSCGLLKFIDDNELILVFTFGIYIIGLKMIVGLVAFTILPVPYDNCTKLNMRLFNYLSKQCHSKKYHELYSLIFNEMYIIKYIYALLI